MKGAQPENETDDRDPDGLFYYSANEKAYRVFDPDTKGWLT